VNENEKIFLIKIQKTLDNFHLPWYNTEEKEVEQAVLTLPYMTRTGRYRKFL